MKKVFVEITAEFTKDGKLIPMSFKWEDGRTFEIEKVYESQRAASLKVGGVGIRYRCRVRNKDIFLFLEDNKWFIEGK